MKKLITCLLLVSAACFSQKNFLKGYYIDNSGKKIDCFIKNSDWKYNPDIFEVKINSDETPREISISEAKEFAIEGFSKYIRETVEIDDSKGEPYYSSSKEPNFIKSTIFLKVLIEGKNSLYRYENNEFPERFFYRFDSQDIKQLIYKKYFKDNFSDLYLNDSYKRQLALNAQCETENSKIESLNYRDGELMDYFKKINACQGDNSYKEISKREKGEIKFKAVVNLSSNNLNLNFQNGNIAGNYDMEHKMTFGFGFEIEAILAFNNKNWAVFAEPTYNNSYTSSIDIYKPMYVYPNYLVSAKYSYIQIPIGLKRNISFKNNSKLYVSSGLNIQISNKSSLDVLNRGIITNTFNLKGTRYNFLIGVGYQFKKMVIELRQYTNTNLNPLVNSDKYSFKNLSLQLKYQIN